ncbi:MAG: DUF3108 domain-containing protein [Bacteroidetes bacterium]|nr:DUF3108 domain-containing protein [Bacteroidota bacterium]MBS1629295.1 DUF3108 domain-containing protein [Bacteroidota bacterium]
MKRKFLLLLSLMLPIVAAAQNEFCNSRNEAFQDGEQLYFKVWYNAARLWIGAGEATCSVSKTMLNGHPAFHIVGEGRTLKSYEWFYKVRDRYESWVDISTMQPMKFVRNVNEGGFRIYNNVVFNQNIGQAVSTNGIFRVPKCVQDVISSIYYARNINFKEYKPGDKIPFSMFLDDEVYHLYIRYIGKERIETRYGSFNAIKLAPLLIRGTIFQGGEKMLVWVSDDENHLPLRVDSPIQIGSVKVDLMGYSGLKHPLSSLISRR